MNNELKRLYDATAEDLLFGIGVLQVPGRESAPYIHIHYPDWPREKLEIVRETFPAGITLVSAPRRSGEHDVYLSTRERAVVQCQSSGLGAGDGHETSILRGPAWNAHLEGVEHEVFVSFERSRQTHGGFPLLVQTPVWEFMTSVDEATGKTAVGPVVARRMDCPS